MNTGLTIEILHRAEAAGVDFIMQLGDFCHDVERDKDYVDFYNDFPVPAYHTLGNHDGEANNIESVLAAYRMKSSYYHFDRNGFRFIVLDTNHIDNLRILDGIVYLELNSASYKYFHEKHNMYPDLIAAGCKAASNIVFWDDPLSAVVELGRDGSLEIAGANSRFHGGITPSMAGLSPFDAEFREIKPSIQSVRMSFRYERRPRA